MLLRNISKNISRNAFVSQIPTWFFSDTSKKRDAI